MVIKRDQPYVYLVHPRRSMAFDSAVWDAGSIVEEAGIGIRNFWTFLQAKPLGSGAQVDLGHRAERALENGVSHFLGNPLVD